MKRIRFTSRLLIMLCAFAFIFSACSSEEKIEPTPGPGAGTEEDSLLEVKIAFPSTDEASTRALSETEEKRIDNLRIFIFTSAGGTNNQLNDKFLYEISNVPTPTGNGDIKTTTISIRKMQQKQRLVLVANLPPTVTLTPSEGQTMQSLFTSIEMAASNWRKNNITGTDPAIPMWGQMRDSILVHTAPLPTSVTVNMFRCLARVDVGVDMDNNNPQLTTDLKIEEIYVCNTSASAYLTPHTDYMKGGGISETEIAKPRPYSTKHTRETYTVATPYKQLVRAIYIPESDIPDSPAGNTPAFLVVKATYKGKAGCYYRIDFAKGGSFVPILRNHAYRMNITAVNSYGYASREEAEAAPPSGLSNNMIIEGINDNINEIVYNDNDMLGISVSEVLFDWDKALVGKATAATGKNEYTMKLYTTYSKWSASIDGTPSWLRLLNSSSAEVTAITDQAQAANAQSSFGIRVLGENLTGKEREATITLTAGMLSLSIKVRQSGGANSHLMRFATGATTASMNLPVAFARAALGGTLDMTNVQARVLWHETVEPLPVTFTATLNGNYVTIKAESTGNTVNGNALIALVRGSGIGMVGGSDPLEVLWSWHVWTMGGSSDTDADFHNPNTTTFMRTSMGRYTSNKGMFYQWGRKDPFPQYTTQASPRIVTVETVTASNTASYVRQHPTVFYSTGSTSYTGWLAAGVGALWTDGVKAAYNDPCPTGWRVPSASEKPEWTTASTLGNGYIAPDNGTHTGGTGQQVWITPGNTGSYPYWNNAGLTQTTATNASGGRPVRCIKDIKLVTKK